MFINKLNQLYKPKRILYYQEASKEQIDESGIPHHLIDFELTESATYDNTDHMLGVLGQLREKGFQISMDDFGTGYFFVVIADPDAAIT